MILYTRPCDRGEWNDSGRETATRTRLPWKRRHRCCCTCAAAPAAACTIPTDPTPVVGSLGLTDACFWANGGGGRRGRGGRTAFVEYSPTRIPIDFINWYVHQCGTTATLRRDEKRNISENVLTREKNKKRFFHVSIWYTYYTTVILQIIL